MSDIDQDIEEVAGCLPNLFDAAEKVASAVQGAQGSEATISIIDKVESTVADLLKLMAALISHHK